MTSAITRHLAEATVFALFVAVLCYCLRKRGASARYALWVIAVIKFAIPAALFSFLGMHLGLFVLTRYSSIVSAPIVSNAISQAINIPIAAVQSPQNWQMLILLSAIWLMGIATALTMWAIRSVTSRGQSSLPCLDAERQALERMQGHLRLRKPVSLRASSSSEFGLWGIWRPVIKIPQDLSSRLTPAELDAVLLHELAHVRRWDNLSGAFVHLVVCCFWFHPLLWWIERRLMVERERACDEIVIRSGIQPHAYVAGILKVCRFQLAHAVAGTSGMTASDFKNRLELIMSYHPQSRSPHAPKALLTVLTAVVTILPVAVGFLRQSALYAQNSAITTHQPQATDKQNGCWAGTEYPEGTVLQMGTHASAPKKLCTQGQWKPTKKPATAVASDLKPFVCEPATSALPNECVCQQHGNFSLGAIVNTSNGPMRCDMFKLGQFSVWRPATSSELGSKQLRQ